MCAPTKKDELDQACSAKEGWLGNWAEVEYAKIVCTWSTTKITWTRNLQEERTEMVAGEEGGRERGWLKETEQPFIVCLSLYPACQLWFFIWLIDYPKDSMVELTSGLPNIIPHAKPALWLPVNIATDLSSSDHWFFLGVQWPAYC